MNKGQNLVAVTVLSVAIVSGALLIAALLNTPLFDQQRLPLFIASLSFVVSAFGVIGSWIVVLEMQRDREALYKPEVYADIELAGGLFLFVVRNDGRSSAHNVTIKLNPSPIDRNGKRLDEVAWLRSPIKTLPPGKRLTKTIDAHTAIFEKDVPRAFSVEIHYESSSGKKYSEQPYILDVDHYRGANVPHPTTEELLNKIATTLETYAKQRTD